jgi:hypothetical protein
MRKRITRILLTALYCMIFITNISGQTTVFTDNFNRASVTPGGTPSMTYTSTVNGANDGVTMNASANLLVGTTVTGGSTATGVTWCTGTLSTYSSPFNIMLSNNGTIIWTFNMRISQQTNGDIGSYVAGSKPTTYTSGVILCTSNVDASSLLTSGTGYAVMLKGVNTGKEIDLVKFSAGLGATTTILGGTTSLLASATNYASVKVVYTASTNTWQLYVRDDTSAFIDPTTGTLTQQGAGVVDNTYTATAMSLFGFINGHATTTSSKRSLFDNFTVAVTSAGTPSWTLADNSQTTAGNILTSSTNNIISRFSLANGGTGSGNLTALNFTTSGTYAATDLSNFKLYYSATNTFPGGTALATISSLLGAGSHTFSSLSQAVATGATGYFWITSDVASGATAGNTINVASIANTDLTYSSGSASGSVSVGGDQTIVAYPAIALTSGSNSTSVNVNNTMTSAVYTYSNVSSDVNVVGNWYTDNTYTTTTTAPNGLSISQNTGAKTMTLSGTPANGVYGTFYYKLSVNETNGNSISGSITVNVPTPTITLTSAVGTNAQVVKAGAAITSITYTVSNATDATIGALPAGLSGSYSNGAFTISGTVDNAATLATTNFTVTATPYTGYSGSSITAAGSIIVKSSTAKSICYLVSGTTQSANDTQIYPNLNNNNNFIVTLRTAAASQPATSVYDNYDLIILNEVVSGTNAEALALKSVNKPILSFKAFTYSSGRWSWGAPDNGKQVTTGTVTVKQSTHPIFNNLTLNSGTLDILSNVAASTNGIQVADVTLTGSIVVATAPKSTTGNPMATSIHDVPGSVRGAGITAKYILIPIADLSYAKVNANGLTLINNAIDYLLNGSQFTAPSLNISSFTIGTAGTTIDEVATPKTITGAVGFSQTMTAITPAITLAGVGTTVSPASGASTNFTTNPVVYTVTDGINSKIYNVTLTQNSAPMASDYFRLAANGGMSTPDSWESSDDNIHWKTSTVAPTSAATQLNILSGKELTINAANTQLPPTIVTPGGKITITNGSSITASSITLQSNSTSTATYVDFNSNSTVATVQQYLSGLSGSLGRGWWYVSSPVSNAKADVFIPNASTNKFGYWDETSFTYPQITDNTTVLNTGQGYVFYNPGSDATVSFTGTLNAGDITINPTRTGTDNGARGFNLVGNPYPSYLDWNAATKTNVRNTIWYRTLTSGGQMQFDTYDGTTGTSLGMNGQVSNYIPPMQAFWVKVDTDPVLPATTSTGSIVFHNADRSHQDQSSATNRLRVKAQTTDAPGIVRLRVSNGVNADEAILVADLNALDAADSFDSPKMKNNNADIPEIFTVAGTEEMVINHLNNFSAGKELALGFRPGKVSDFSIAANEISNVSSDLKVVLVDNLTKATYDLTDGSAYTFSTTDAAATSSRFSVQFKSAGVVNNIGENAYDKIVVYGNAQHQIVMNLNNQMVDGTISVFNALGQKLMDKVVTGNFVTIDQSFVPGIYVVEFTVSNQRLIKKVVLK